MGAGARVHEYTWASSTRLVFSLAENFGADAAPSPTGEIYAIDVDGKRGNYLFGFRGEGVKTGTRIGRNTRENAYGELIRRSEEHTSELQSLMRISYAVFCLKKKTKSETEQHTYRHAHLKNSEYRCYTQTD